jgi:hypothetical protein
MDSDVNVLSSSVSVLNINIIEHSSSINKASNNRLLILLVSKDNCYSCILASIIYNYLLHNLVSFDQGFTGNIIIKNKQEEFAA